MMAVCAASGALLLVLLTGAGYSYPTKMGSDPSSSYSGNYGAKHASAGSGWKAPYSGEFAVSGSASKTVSNPARPHTAPRKEPRYSEVSAPVAAASGSNALAAPVHSGHSGSSPAGSAQPSPFQPAPTEGFTWAVAPPSPFSGEKASRRPSASRFSSSKPAPQPPGLSNVSPFVPPPEFQAGELSHMENSYEHGNYESETEERGFLPPPPPPPGIHGVTGPDPDSEESLRPSGIGRGWVMYPYYDYMFLTGQYPPGTVTHFSSSFEQGRDYWQDTHYMRDHFPANPSTQEVETFPAAPEAPQSLKQPSQPVKQTAGTTGHGHIGGQNQPYRGGVGLAGSSQPGSYRWREAGTKL